MGLLDSALSMLSGSNSTDPSADPKAAVMQAAVGLLANHEGGPAAGMQTLISTLQSSGLADHVASWAGNGQNLPVTGEQIQQALGSNGILQQLAETAGLPHDQVAGHLAEMLPGIIEKFSQNGGSAGGLGGLAGMLGQFMGQNKA
jgi:uncharacterized protein YidB (DUF937 family)